MKVYIILSPRYDGVYKIFVNKQKAEVAAKEAQSSYNYLFYVEECEIEDAKTVYVLEDTDYGTNIAWSLDRAEIEELGKQLGHWVAFIKEITNTKDRYDGKLA